MKWHKKGKMLTQNRRRPMNAVCLWAVCNCVCVELYQLEMQKIVMFIECLFMHIDAHRIAWIRFAIVTNDVVVVDVCIPKNRTFAQHAESEWGHTTFYYFFFLLPIRAVHCAGWQRFSSNQLVLFVGGERTACVRHWKPRQINKFLRAAAMNSNVICPWPQ